MKTRNYGQVYGLFDITTNELFYIGSSTDVERRIIEHAKAGVKDFTYKVLFTCPESYVRLMECYFITKAVLEGKNIINVGGVLKNDGRSIMLDTSRRIGKHKTIQYCLQHYSLL